MTMFFSNYSNKKRRSSTNPTSHKKSMIKNDIEEALTEFPFKTFSLSMYVKNERTSREYIVQQCCTLTYYKLMLTSCKMTLHYSSKSKLFMTQFFHQTMNPDILHFSLDSKEREGIY